jgi:hypothetical protein
MGEQTNCDLTRYLKKEANHVGPTLEARLYTLEMLCITFDVSCQLSERGEACLVRPLPRPRVWWLAESQDEEKLCLLRLCPLPRPRARWLAGRGENFTTPSVRRIYTPHPYLG